MNIGVFMSIRLLITGTSGFIGKNLEEKLSTKYEVLAPKSIELDLCNQDAVESYLLTHKVDVIIHSANYRKNITDNNFDEKVLQCGLRMYANLEKFNYLYKKMLYFGSGAEYDRRYYQPFMKEDYFGKHIPEDGYGFYKYWLSKQCAQKDNIYDLRLFGVYGKYEDWTRRFISNNICRALKGKSMTLSQNCFFDYIYIDDLINIIEWFIEHDPIYKHYNVCRGQHIDLLTLGMLIKKIMKIKQPILVEKSGYKMEYSGNNERLLAELGNYSFKSFEETIEEMVLYYKELIDQIDEKLL